MIIILRHDICFPFPIRTITLVPVWITPQKRQWMILEFMDANFMMKLDYANLQGESLTNSNPRSSDETEERRSQSSTATYKPNSQAVTLRLPDTMIEEIKQLARKRDTSFQTLVKSFLSEKLSEVK